MDEKSTNRTRLGKVLCWASSALKSLWKGSLWSCTKNPKLESDSPWSFIRRKVAWRWLKRSKKRWTLWSASWWFELQQLFLWKKWKRALCFWYRSSAKRILSLGLVTSGFHKLYVGTCRHANQRNSGSRSKQQGVPRLDCGRIWISDWKRMGGLKETVENDRNEKVVLREILYSGSKRRKHSSWYEAIHWVYCQHFGKRIEMILNYWIKDLKFLNKTNNFYCELK